MKRVLFFFPLFLLLTNQVTAHSVEYHLSNVGVATVIQFTQGGKNHPFSFKSYEIYSLGNQVPFQVGRTDKLGRVIFLPNKKGEWKIRTFSEDGHGTRVTIKVDEGYEVKQTTMRTNLYERILIGVSVIFGLLGVLSLFRKR